MSKMKLNNSGWMPVALAATAFALTSFTSQAQAQGSVTLKKGQLQQAGWYKSAPQIQIVDDGPIVHDYRTAPQQDQGFQIPIGPAGNNGRIPEGGIPLGSGQNMVRMAPSTLPQAGFGTNIPASGMGPARALPSTKMGNLGNQYAAQQQANERVSARPIGLGRPVSAQAGPARAASPASYGGGYGTGAGGYSGGGGGANTSVRAKLLGK